MRLWKLLSILSLVAVVACSSGGDDDDDGVGDDDDDGAVWQPLITGSWALDPFSEETSDVHTLTITQDITIGAIRPIAPPGTHHTVLYRNGSAINGMIYASGVGTGELTFPEGVGLTLSSGDILSLELHLFNAEGTPLEGVSGVEVVAIAQSEVQNEANLMVPGPLSLDLQPGVSSVTHDCTINSARTIFALFPHMHQLGTHLRSVATIGGQAYVLRDAAYNFDGQSFDSFTPLAMQPGDTITTECTWDNVTGVPVYWGESSDAEMCFSILYRWPAGGDELCP